MPGDAQARAERFEAEVTSPRDAVRSVVDVDMPATPTNVGGSDTDAAGRDGALDRLMRAHEAELPLVGDVDGAAA